MTAIFIGFAMFAQYYIPTDGSSAFLKRMAQWDRIVAAFALVLGLQSLIQVHSLKIQRKVAGWGYSVMVFLGMILTVFFGLIHEAETIFNAVLGTSIDVSSTFGTWSGDDLKGSSYNWIYMYIFVPCSASMFSILAFFIASAAYRTFRARTHEAAILLLAALIVMLGRVPLGSLIYEAIPSWADWIMSTPNMAAKRGILLGVSLGAVATALRIILGIEKSYLGGSSDE